MRYEENSLNLQPKKKIDTMTSKICRLCILLPLLLMSFSARGANAINMPEFYSRWDGYGNDKLMSMGRLFLNQRFNIDSALVCYSIVANRLQNNVHDKQDANLYIRALNNLGYLYYTYYNSYTRADALFDEAIELSEEYAIKEHLPYLYLNKGNVTYIYESVRGADESLQKIVDNFKKTFQASVEQKKWECTVAAFYGLSMFYINMGEKDLSSISQEIDTYSRLDIPDSIALKGFTHTYLQVIQEYRTGHYDQCISILDDILSQLDHSQKSQYDNIANTYSSIIRLCRMTGDHAKAVAYSNEFERFVQGTDNYTSMIQAYGLMQEMYKELGQLDKAEHYEFLKLRAKDELQEKHQLDDMGQNRFLRRLTQVGEELQTEQASNRWKTIVLLIVSVAFILLVVVLVFLVRSLRRERRYINVLYEKNQRLLESGQLLGNVAETPDDNEGTEQMITDASTLVTSEETSTTVEAEQPSEEAAPAITEERTEEGLEASPASKISGQVRENIKNSIVDVMDRSDVICSQDFSLSRLCELTGYSHSYVSQVIRDTWDTNFNTLLNNYRIKEACRCMNDIEHYGNYTLEAIATTVGYASRSHFSTTFKKMTGMTAAEYFKAARRNAKPAV